MLHFQGQMTCERIVAPLAGMGRFPSGRWCGSCAPSLRTKLESFRVEDDAVLRAGLVVSPFVTVDDTGARHAGKACFTTPIGSDRFPAFRTGPSRAWLSSAVCSAGRRDTRSTRRAVAYMHGALPQGVIDKLAGHASRGG